MSSWKNLGSDAHRIVPLLWRCNTISPEVAKKLAAFAIPGYHPKGTVLLVEGQPSHGAFVLCSGRVKLFTTSADGKALILRFADPGEILGLAGMLSGQPCEAWAQATQDTHTNYIDREHFVDVMQQDGVLALQMAAQLGESYCSAIADLREMGLSRSASQKLAIFLLKWCDSPSRVKTVAQFDLTHEEIAQVLGLARETVTRILSGFKKKGLIEWEGGHLVLTNKAVLKRATN